MADQKSELYELKRIGATPVKNSGRGAHKKGDGILYDKDDNPIYTVDVKEAKKSFGLTKSVWAKVTSDALQNQTRPLLLAVIGEDEPRKRVVIVDEDMFLDMWEKYID